MSYPAHVADTVPYPWPYDGCFDSSRTALVICGAQRQLIDASTGADVVADRLGAAATAVRAAGGQVIWVRHGRRARQRPGVNPRPTALLPTRESAGWQLAAATADGDIVVDTDGWDGCYGSGLDHTLRSGGLTTVLLGGFASEITVDSTVRTLNDQGHECLVLTDGCAPIDPALGARAHHSLTMSGGIFGALGTSDSLLHLIDQMSDDIDLKEISA